MLAVPELAKELPTVRKFVLVSTAPALLLRLPKTLMVPLLEISAPRGC
jgi:hypothetical protein